VEAILPVVGWRINVRERATEGSACGADVNEGQGDSVRGRVQMMRMQTMRVQWVRARTRALGVGLFSLAAVIGGLALSVGPERVARAQQAAAPDAPTIAAWVQRFYDQTTSMNARFVQRYTNRVYSRVDTSRGTVRFKKPGMMRFDYDQPNGKVIVSDGQRLLVYEPPDGGRGAGQYYEQEMANAQLPAALAFLTGTGRLADDFTFRRLDPVRQRYPDGQVLELRPRAPTPHYSRILLYVDDDPQRRGVVHRILIVDSTNNENRFDFEQQQFNREIPENTFRFRPPRGARRIQP
jgi:outer membrane lipoprotein carrier protein